VRKLLPLLACLMLVLTTWAGMAHAAEAGDVEMSRTDAAPAPGDGDEVPADADKGCPHHHASCHEHPVNKPVVRTKISPTDAASTIPPAVPSRAPEAIGDGRHWRVRLGDAADPVRPVDALRPLRRVARPAPISVRQMKDCL